MTTNAIKTQGTLVKRGDGGSPSEVFTTIGEVRGFGGVGGGSSSEIDVTHFGSTAKEFLQGLKDEGEITVDCNFLPDDAQQQGMWADRTNATLRNFTITLTDSPATVFSLSAYVKAFEITGQYDDAVRATATLRVSGPVTWS